MQGGFQAPAIPPVPALPSKDVVEESDMLQQFLAAMAGLEGAEAIFDWKGKLVGLHYGHSSMMATRGTKFLGGDAPDITIVPRGLPVDAFNAVALIELQRGDIDNKHRGKGGFFSERLLDANPARPFASCIVTNMEVAELFAAKRPETPGAPNDMERSFPVPMSGEGWVCVMGFLWQTAEQLGRQLPDLRTPTSLCIATKFLGGSRGVSVYAADGDKVCKLFQPSRRRAFEAELEVLRAVAKAPHPVLPLLVDSGELLLVTTPAVKPLRTMTDCGLKELFRGIKHMHIELKFVHGDLEPKHICTSCEDEGVRLIDLGSWKPLPPTPRISRSGYSGTLLFASDDVLGWFEGDTFEPHVRQDLVALVKAVYVSLHKGAQEDIALLEYSVQQALIGDGPKERAAAAALVRRFWDTEFSQSTTAGRMWQAMVKEAHDVEPEGYDATLEALENGMALKLRANK